MKKLRNKSGESLIETLVSVLIVCLALSFLAMAVLSAGKINARVQNSDLDFSYDGTAAKGDATINGKTQEIDIYENNGYYFYGD